MSMEIARPMSDVGRALEERIGVLFVDMVGCMTFLPEWKDLDPLERKLSAALTLGRRALNEAIRSLIADGEAVEATAATAALVAKAEDLGLMLAKAIPARNRREAFTALVTAFAEAAKLHEAV